MDYLSSLLANVLQNLLLPWHLGYWYSYLVLPILIYIIFYTDLGFREKRYRRNRKPKNSKRTLRAANDWLIRFRQHPFEYTPKQRMTYIRRNDFFLFELVILAALKDRGHRIKTTPFTRDQGIDGHVWIKGHDTETHWLIQAKRYKGQISIADVKKFKADVDNHPSATHGMFVSSGSTSRNTLELIREFGNIELISGNRLLDLLDGPAIISGDLRLHAKETVLA